MSRTLIAVGIIMAALAAAWAYQRLRPSSANRTSQIPTYTVPTRLQRWDFSHPNSKWLLVVFTSKTCSTCAAVATAAQQLANDSLAVTEVEYSRHQALHNRYDISAVPLTVLVDNTGLVIASLAGPATATELADIYNSARTSGR
ncbi:MAG: thioredoxin domain-containing protein [bacterium]|nr:thioredoxin domain-containing protein [bacterium]